MLRALKLEVEKEKSESGPQMRETTSDLKSILFNFAWHLKKRGYADSTIQSQTKILRVLARRGADLYEPESVKGVIAKQNWSSSRKRNAVYAYTNFLKTIGGKWDPPTYERPE